MSDPIERQAAIDVIDAVFPVDPMKSGYAQGIACGAALAIEYVKQLPSAQPHQIVRCKDCKWGAQDEDGWWYCVEIGDRMGDGEKGDGFCSDAERRTDGKNT